MKPVDEWIECDLCQGKKVVDSVDMAAFESNEVWEGDRTRGSAVSGQSELRETNETCPRCGGNGGWTKGSQGK